MKHPDSGTDWFVVGFAFSNWDEVLLIEKQKSWCLGLWNGVGGLIEESDQVPGRILSTAQNAMAREFEEETGLGTHPSEWDLFCDLSEPNARVFFFRIFSYRSKLVHARMMTPERVGLWHHTQCAAKNMMPNLCWLVPMARKREVLLARVDEQGGQYDGKR